MPAGHAPITTAVKATETLSAPLQFDGTPIPITGTFPMLITPQHHHHLFLKSVIRATRVPPEDSGVSE